MPAFDPRLTLGIAHAINLGLCRSAIKGMRSQRLAARNAHTVSSSARERSRIPRLRRAPRGPRRVRLRRRRCIAKRHPARCRHARIFDEYFTGWKPDREPHGGSLASHIEDLRGQTRLGIIMCAFDYPDGAGRGDRALSENGSSWHSRSSRNQMQKPSARKFHGSPSREGIFGRLRLISPALRPRISPPSPTSRFRPR